MANDTDWAEARRRASVISLSLLDASPSRRLTVAEAARELDVKLSTFYRWRALFEPDRRVSCLLPRDRGRPSGTRMIDPAVEGVIDRNIHSFYLTRERPTLQELLLRIHADCDAAHLPKPNWRTVRRRIDRIDARHLVTKREGPNAASTVSGSILE